MIFRLLFKTVLWENWTIEQCNTINEFSLISVQRGFQAVNSQGVEDRIFADKLFEFREGLLRWLEKIEAVSDINHPLASISG